MRNAHPDFGGEEFDDSTMHSGSEFIDVPKDAQLERISYSLDSTHTARLFASRREQNKLVVHTPQDSLA